MPGCYSKRLGQVTHKQKSLLLLVLENPTPAQVRTDWISKHCGKPSLCPWSWIKLGFAGKGKRCGQQQIILASRRTAGGLSRGCRGGSAGASGAEASCSSDTGSQRQCRSLRNWLGGREGCCAKSSSSKTLLSWQLREAEYCAKRFWGSFYQPTPLWVIHSTLHSGAVNSSIHHAGWGGPAALASSVVFPKAGF